MFWFIKKCFFVLSTFLTSVNSLNCISMAKVRPEIITVNSNEPVFYPFSIKQVNVVVVAIMLMIRMQKYAFLMM